MVLVQTQDPHNERALAEILHSALEEHDSATPVQSVSEAVRLELVIPEAIRCGLVALPKKHDNVFWRERKVIISLLYRDKTGKYKG